MDYVSLKMHALIEVVLHVFVIIITSSMLKGEALFVIAVASQLFHHLDSSGSDFRPNRSCLTHDLGYNLTSHSEH